MKQKAILYCRVSGKKQTVDGSGLDSQEYRCRQYADAKGYEVEDVFGDDVTGGGDFMKRPGMVALLRYLDERPGMNYVVIFDDLKRYARDVEFHLKLRRLMSERGATRECLNFNFEDSPEGKFNEIISAAAGELERLQMGRQNRQKSIARLEQGYAVLSQPPVGYRYEKSAQGGKVLVRDEPHASVVQEALEGYATRRFESQVEVKRFLESHPQFPRGKEGEIRQMFVVRMLRQKLYAGYVESTGWGVPVRQGNHEGLVSAETFERIQQRLDQGVYAQTRKDIKQDFPLRGAVCCGDCDTPLTAGWSKGKYKKYPYYFCREKGCAQYGKSIARDKIEGRFADLLQSIEPKQGLVRAAALMFRDLWDHQAKHTENAARSLKQDIQSAESKVDQMVERIVDATNPRVIAAFEKRIDEMERQKLVLQEKMLQIGKPRRTFDEMFELSMRFLSNPCKIWNSGRIEAQRLVLKLVFLEHLAYCRNEGFRTPKTAFPFNVLGGFSEESCKMVLPEGIELSTSPLPRECSTTELRQPCLASQTTGGAGPSGRRRGETSLLQPLVARRPHLSRALSETRRPEAATKRLRLQEPRRLG
ncbi:MAG: hypothetical protein Kilf2KO_43230 [Rhodospirillales bacterium]